MPTAFGRAMLDTINGQPQRFRMNMLNGPSLEMSCDDFLHCRQEEQQLLGGIDTPLDGRVLDYGCGAGRYLSHIRQNHSRVQCIGIEICDLLREHCARVEGTWMEMMQEVYLKVKVFPDVESVWGADGQDPSRWIDRAIQHRFRFGQVLLMPRFWIGSRRTFSEHVEQFWTYHFSPARRVPAVNRCL
jgi:hypothetical protein